MNRSNGHRNSVSVFRFLFNNSPADEQLSVVEDDGLPLGDGALGLVKLDAHGAAFCRVDGRGGGLVGVADLGLDAYGGGQRVKGNEVD